MENNEILKKIAGYYSEIDRCTGEMVDLEIEIEDYERKIKRLKKKLNPQETTEV